MRIDNFYDGNKTNSSVSFNPDKRIDIKENSKNMEQADYYNPDQRLEINDKNEYFSQYEDRLRMVPAENAENGYWEGVRGESKFIPTYPPAQKELQRFGQDGIVYKDANPDFSKVSVGSVKIEMTNQRYTTGYGENRVIGNFEKADTELAKKWNEDRKDGRSNWTALDIKNYRQENNLSWHECSDMTTCHLVSRAIHGVCTHTGGIYEYNLYTAMQEGMGFDD